jgi:hypothetical protein
VARRRGLWQTDGDGLCSGAVMNIQQSDKQGRGQDTGCACTGGDAESSEDPDASFETPKECVLGYSSCAADEALRDLV